MTNINGLASLGIGTGTPVSGTFAGIDWAAGPYFIKSETDPAGGTNYILSGTSEMLSVPYALYALGAGDDGDWAWSVDTVSTDKLVGIGTNSPTTELEVIGMTKTDELQIPTGAVNGHFLKSDAEGKGSWSQLNAGDLFDMTLADFSCIAEIGEVNSPNGLSELTVSGGHAYINDGDRISAIDVTYPANPSIVGTLNLSPSQAQVLKAQGDVLYAIEGGLQQLRIIDISDPTSMSTLGSYSFPGFPQGLAVEGDYAFVTENNGGTILHVIDVSNPALPISLATVPVGTNPTSISVFGDHVYVSCSGDATLRIIDFSTPVSPIAIGLLNTPEPWGVSFSGGYAFMATRLEDFIKVVDISDPTSPSIVDSIPGAGYPRGISIIGNYGFAFNDNSAIIQVIDISNPTEIEEIDTFEIISPGAYLTGMVVSDNNAYVANNGGSDFVVLSLACEESYAIGIDPLTGEASTLPAEEIDPVFGASSAAGITGTDITNWNNKLDTELDPEVSSSTTNKVPKWNGTSLTDGSISDVSGNVGIGTDSPGALLDVDGDALIHGITVGHGAGIPLSDNTVFGSNAFSSNTNGNFNTAIGSNTIASSLVGNENTAVGASTLNNTTGNANTAVGSGALYSHVSGFGNTALGAGAGLNALGGQNVFIGYNAGVNETGSNTLYIDNSGTTTPLIFGDFSADMLRVNGTLNINSAYNLPTADGTDGYVISTNGAGVASWTDPASLTVTETDPQVASATTNSVPLWNGTSLVDGSISDVSGNIGIGLTPSAYKLEVGGETKSTSYESETGNTNTPSYSFSADSNTGMYNVSGNVLGFTAGGLTQLRVTSNGLRGGGGHGLPNVPVYGFHVDGHTGMYSPSNDVIGFSTAGIERFRITSLGISLPGKTTTNELAMSSGATLGYIPVSSADGTMIWTDPATITSAPQIETDPEVASSTINTVPLWNGTSLVDGSISDVSGNLGIGTSAPDQALDVNGGLRVSTGQRDEGILITAGGTDEAGSGRVFFQENDDAMWGMSMSYNGVNATGDLGVPINTFAISRHENSTNGSIVLSIPRNADRVGINTDSPTQTLDVDGQIRMRTGSAAGYIPVSSADGTMTWSDPATLGSDITTASNGLTETGSDIQLGGSLLSNTTIAQGANTLDFTSSVTDAFSVDGTTFSVDAANNRVGIGTNTPTANFHVYEPGAFLSARFESNTHAQVYIAGTANQERSLSFVDNGSELNWKVGLDNGNGSGGNNADFIVKTGNNTSPEFVIQRSTGNVGIANNAPTEELDVNGQIRMRTGGTAGHVPVSSADGTMTWTAPAAVGTVGDIKQGLQTVNHGGWYILDGQAISGLPASAQTAAASLGWAGNLPDMDDRFLKNSSGAQSPGDLNGSNTVTIQQTNIPNYTLTGSTTSGGEHVHAFEDYHYIDTNTGNIFTGGSYQTGSGDATGSIMDTNHNTTNTGSTHSHSVTVNSGGSGTAMTVTPANMVVNTFVFLGN